MPRQFQRNKENLDVVNNSISRCLTKWKNNQKSRIIMSTEVATWDKVMSLAISVPGVKVNRSEFLVAA